MQKINLLLISLLSVVGALAQPNGQVIDQIIGVVGNEIILSSDIQIQKNQMREQGYTTNLSDCDILQEILFEKLLLNQSKIDSIEVTDDMINTELEKRINVFIRQIGSEEALEAYYKKSISEIKEEFREILRDQMLVQQMQGQITTNVNVTPADVRNYFESIPADSLPFVNASVEMEQIVVYPEPGLDQIKQVRERLLKYRDQVRSGEYDFETLAVMYSDDPGSSSKGGELGLKPRGTFVTEFDATAFNLKPGEISAPFKTEYGYHIMELVERRGELYNARHILIIPEISSTQLSQAKNKLDSIADLIRKDSLSFEQAAVRFSDDERSKNQNGRMVNEATGSNVYDMDELDPQIFLTIDTLETGEFSNPTFFQTRTGKKGYRIIKLTNRTEPHRANLDEDYQLIQNATTQKLNQEEMESWVQDKIRNTYIRLNAGFLDCDFDYDWSKTESQAEAQH